MRRSRAGINLLITNMKAPCLFFAALFVAVSYAAKERPAASPGSGLNFGNIDVSGEANFAHFVTMQGTLNGVTANFSGDLTVTGESGYGDNAYFGKKLMLGNTTPHSSARLEVSGTTGGILFPRLTTTQRLAILAPANGLVVYQTDGATGLYLRDAGAWRRLAMN